MHPRKQSLWGSPESHSPRSEMVESAGNAPISLLAGQVHCLSATTPEIGTPPRCCPERTEFWRLCRASWRSAYGKLIGLPSRSPLPIWQKSVFARCASTRQSSSSASLRVKAGAVAGGCARTCSLASSHSAVKSQPRKLKGPGTSLHSRPMPFQ